MPLVQLLRNNFLNRIGDFPAQNVLAVLHHGILVIGDLSEVNFAVRVIGSLNRLHIQIFCRQFKGKLTVLQRPAQQLLRGFDDRFADGIVGVRDHGGISQRLLEFLVCRVINCRLQRSVLVVFNLHPSIEVNRVGNTRDVLIAQILFLDLIDVGASDIRFRVGDGVKTEFKGGFVFLVGTDGNFRISGKRHVRVVPVQGEGPEVALLVVAAGQDLRHVDRRCSFRVIPVRENGRILRGLIRRLVINRCSRIQRTVCIARHGHRHVQRMIVIGHAVQRVGVRHDLLDRVGIIARLDKLDRTKREGAVFSGDRHRRIRGQRSLLRHSGNLKAIGLALHPGPAGQLLFSAQHDGFSGRVDIAGDVCGFSRAIAVLRVRLDDIFSHRRNDRIIIRIRGLRNRIFRTGRQVLQHGVLSGSQHHSEMLIVRRLHVFRPFIAFRNRSGLAQLHLELEGKILFFDDDAPGHLFRDFQAAHLPRIVEMGIKVLVLTHVIRDGGSVLIHGRIRAVHGHLNFILAGIIGHDVLAGIVHHLRQVVFMNSHVVVCNLGRELSFREDAGLCGFPHAVLRAFRHGTGLVQRFQPDPVSFRLVRILLRRCAGQRDRHGNGRCGRLGRLRLLCRRFRKCCTQRQQHGQSHQRCDPFQHFSHSCVLPLVHSFLWTFRPPADRSLV